VYSCLELKVSTVTSYQLPIEGHNFHCHLGDLRVVLREFEKLGIASVRVLRHTPEISYYFCYTGKYAIFDLSII